MVGIDEIYCGVGFLLQCIRVKQITRALRLPRRYLAVNLAREEAARGRPADRR